MGASLTGAADSDGPILVRRDGRMLFVTLNRPGSLNALVPRMVGALGSALDAAADDSGAQAVVLESGAPTCFSAGHDLAGLARAIAADRDAARAQRRAMYALVRRIASFPKPLIALVDGMAIGAAVGVAAAARHRICSAGARMALPETSVGTMPDAGVTWRLSRAPGGIGMMLALTGGPLTAADAVLAGLADGVAGCSLDELKARLANPFAGPVEQVVRSALARPGPGEIAGHRPLIERIFAEPTVRAMAAALERDGSEPARRFARCLAMRSPLALEVVHRTLQRIRTARTLDEAIPIEYMSVCRLSEAGDAAEGARVLLAGGSEMPRWSPASLADVDPASIDEIFTPMLPGEAITP